MSSEKPTIESSEMIASQRNNTTYDQETNCLPGVEPTEHEEHTAQFDEFVTYGRFPPNLSDNEVIDYLICNYTIRTFDKDYCIQDADEHKANLGVSNTTMPELKSHSAVLFIGNPSPCDLTDDMAKQSANIMHTFESQYLNRSSYDGYQIELRRIGRNSSLCRLSLRVNIFSWYRLEAERDTNIEETIDYYIQQLKEEYEDKGFLSSSKQCQNGRIENLWSCKKEVLVDGEWSACGFFVQKPYCIYETDKFYAVARPNGLPIITVCPIEHCQNEDWMRTPAAWKAVLEVLRYIQWTLRLSEAPFFRMYINFRKWHAQIRDGRCDGHAHINIVLTSAVIEACKKTDSNLRCLSESTVRPPNYRRDDANALKEVLNKKKV